MAEFSCPFYREIQVRKNHEIDESSSLPIYMTNIINIITIIRLVLFNFNSIKILSKKYIRI
jgi:hypothetical protein